MTDDDGVISDGVTEPLDGEHVVIQPQRGKGYRFGKDSIALACFAAEYVKDGAKTLELCSGCGVVGMILALKKRVTLLGVELDETLYRMSVASAERNRLTKVEFINADVRTLTDTHSGSLGRFDAVVCNPPFYKRDSRPSIVAPSANSELTVTFDDVARTANAFLNDGGEFFFVHTASRLDEAVSVCRGYGLTPKNLVIDPNGKTFLLRCVRGGKSGLSVEVKEFACFTS